MAHQIPAGVYNLTVVEVKTDLSKATQNLYATVKLRWEDTDRFFFDYLSPSEPARWKIQTYRAGDFTEVGSLVGRRYKALVKLEWFQGEPRYRVEILAERVV